MKFMHLGTKTLESNRLILKPFDINQYELIYKNWASDSNVTKYLTWDIHPNKEFTHNLISQWNGLYSNKNYYHWSINLKEGDIPIGAIIARMETEDSRIANMGYVIGSRWWHQGYMTEALTTVIKFLFEKVGMDIIEAVHHVDNINSGKVMQKSGMKYKSMCKTTCHNVQVDGCLYWIRNSDNN